MPETEVEQESVGKLPWETQVSKFGNSNYYLNKAKYYKSLSDYQPQFIKRGVAGYQPGTDTYNSYTYIKVPDENGQLQVYRVPVYAVQNANRVRQPKPVEPVVEEPVVDEPIVDEPVRRQPVVKTPPEKKKTPPQTWFIPELEETGPGGFGYAIPGNPEDIIQIIQEVGGGNGGGTDLGGYDIPTKIPGRTNPPTIPGLTNPPTGSATTPPTNGPRKSTSRPPKSGGIKATLDSLKKVFRRVPDPENSNLYAYKSGTKNIYYIDPAIAAEVVRRAKELQQGNAQNRLDYGYYYTASPVTGYNPGDTIYNTNKIYVNKDGTPYYFNSYPEYNSAFYGTPMRYDVNPNRASLVQNGRLPITRAEGNESEYGGIYRNSETGERRSAFPYENTTSGHFNLTNAGNVTDGQYSDGSYGDFSQRGGYSTRNEIDTNHDHMLSDDELRAYYISKGFSPEMANQMVNTAHEYQRQAATTFLPQHNEDIWQQSLSIHKNGGRINYANLF